MEQRSLRARRGVALGDRVDIKAGDERGGWGIVRYIDEDHFHVGLYGSTSDVRVYERSEITRPRSRS
jgi:ribosomal protein L24